MSEATVGVIDDDLTVRRALARMLTACGYNVEAYESPAAFLQHAAPDAFDCLLVDVRMPDMTGFDFREHLAARGYDLPVIFITGDDDTGAAAIASHAEGVSVLVKPFDEDALLAAIAGALGTRSSGTTGASKG